MHRNNVTYRKNARTHAFVALNRLPFTSITMMPAKRFPMVACIADDSKNGQYATDKTRYNSDIRTFNNGKTKSKTKY